MPNKLNFFTMGTILATSLIGPPKACEAAPRPVVGDFHKSSFDRPIASPIAPGRFFIIERLHSGNYICELRNIAGLVSWRFFGTTDEDYLRAWEFGHDWADRSNS